MQLDLLLLQPECRQDDQLFHHQTVERHLLQDIELIDAYGHRVDLHDHDWNFTLKLDCEYEPH